MIFELWILSFGAIGFWISIEITDFKNKKLIKMQASTSKAAHQKIKELEIDLKHGERILKALEVLGTSTGEAIANYLCMDVHQVMRRISELERKLDDKGNPLVYKPGTKKPNRKGNMCYEYSLVNFGPKVQHKSEKALPGKAVVDYAKELIKQPTLF